MFLLPKCLPYMHEYFYYICKPQSTNSNVFYAHSRCVGLQFYRSAARSLSFYRAGLIPLPIHSTPHSSPTKYIRSNIEQQDNMNMNTTCIHDNLQIVQLAVFAILSRQLCLTKIRTFRSIYGLGASCRRSQQKLYSLIYSR